MAKEAPVLEGLRVASPCPVPWESMEGDERVRHCGACRLNVFNLSAMTRREAEDLVGRTEGRLCVRFFRRADGTVLTRDCPVGLAAVRRRLRVLGGTVAAAFAAILLGGCGRAPDSGGGGGGHTTGILAPPPSQGDPPPPEPVMGDVAEPPGIQGEVFVPPAPPKQAPRGVSSQETP